MKGLIFSFILISFQYAISQTSYELSGEIINESSETIPLVNVTLNNKRFSITDGNGNFIFKKVSKGQHILKISSIGFETLNKTIVVTENISLKYVLKESLESLSTVVISGTKKTKSEIIEDSPLTIESLDIEKVIEKDNDLVSELDRTSGVQVRNSGSVGDTSEITLNGLTGTAIRIFVDGIPLDYLYPNVGFGAIPLADVQTVNVYKGILPVDLGIDALGGAINIITKDKDKNKLRATYSGGSFNTHFGSVYANLVDKNSNFFNVNAGINSSDNNYKFIADISTGIVGDPLTKQKVERFHDAYRLAYTGITVGTKDKKWTDFAQISYNYLDVFTEYNNTARVSQFAVGEAEGEAQNYALVAKYKKYFFDKRLEFNVIGTYSRANGKNTDIGTNAYNWLGNVIEENNTPGELGTGVITKYKSENIVIRPTLKYNLNKNNKLVFSNLNASKSDNYTELDGENVEVSPTQNLTKNILGLGLEGKTNTKKLEYFSSIKYYTYMADIISNNVTDNIKDNFYGWNVGAKFDINRFLAVKASYERGFLIPTLGQLTGDFLLTLPNPLLKPEESDNYNLGIQASYNKTQNIKASLNASVFIRNQENRIFLEAGNVTSQFKNSEGNIDVKGFETELTLTFFKNLICKGNATFQEVLRNDGTALPNNPDLFYDLQLNYSNKKLLGKNIPWNVYTSYHYVTLFNHRTVGALDTPENNPNNYIPEQSQLDTGFSFKTLKENNLTCAFNLQNVLDEEVYDNFRVPKPGRNFNIKLIYELDKF